MSSLKRFEIKQTCKKMSYEERMDHADDDLERIAKKARTKEAQMVSLRDESYQVLGEAGLAECVVESFEKTGYHPWNRSEGGIVKAKVVQKVDDFDRSGVSELECAKAVSVERLPGAAGNQHEAANIKTAAESEGVLAPVKAGELTQFCLTINHTTQAIKSVNAGCVHENKNIAPRGRPARTLVQDGALLEPKVEGQQRRLARHL